MPQEGRRQTADEAVKLATSMGFPVVLKIVSPDILHKTDAGGVLVGVKSADEARRASTTIMANAKKYDAKANDSSASRCSRCCSGGQEVIVGAVTDPRFGKLVAFGLGGVLVEVLKDMTFRLAPVDPRRRAVMLDGIQAAEMLKGVRGAEPVDRDALGRSAGQRLAAGHRLPGDRRAGPQPGLRDRGGRDRRRRPHRRRLRRRSASALPPGAGARSSTAMNRIMKPEAVAVIGASTEDGKIGNSVMKNLINGGYKGEIYPIHPKADEILGNKAYKSVKDVPGDDRRRRLRDPGEVRRRRR